mmetsp:Transcript_25062/g.63059  ORF Transcript_25062/g.63059 Transcript_25062/m.63059 type:complete len:91 (+) Transcript_25062:288-560(+)
MGSNLLSKNRRPYEERKKGNKVSGVQTEERQFDMDDENERSTESEWSERSETSKNKERRWMPQGRGGRGGRGRGRGRTPHLDAVAPTEFL